MMLGTAVSWFLLDICFYANSLFNADITKALGFGTTAFELSLSSMAITSMALPGYWLSICLMDKIGRKMLQLAGFIFIGLLYAILGAQYVRWRVQNFFLFRLLCRACAVCINTRVMLLLLLLLFARPCVALRCVARGS